MSGNPWPLMIVAFVLTVVVLTTYTVWVLRRGRQLSRAVPPEQRRWL